jgi:hypothetical protein
MKKSFNDRADKLVKIGNIFDLLANELPHIPHSQLQLKNDILNRKKNFLEMRWTLSVAGEIKTGKSTLLNTLLFGDKEVLPESQTPHTAKITRVRWAEKDTCKVNFMSKGQLDEILNYESTDEGNAPEIKLVIADLKSVMKQEQRLNELLGTTKEIDFSELKLYVTPIEKGGRFTPIVNEIEIGRNHESLRTVDIVDTPGLNDPNPVRSLLTEHWIRSADCVIFTSYVQKVFPKNDLRFLQDALDHIVPSKQLFVITKLDTVNDEQLEEVKEDLQSRVYVESDVSPQNTFFTSARGAQVAARFAAGTQKSEELAFRERNLRYLDSEINGVKRLEDQILSVLTSNGEQDIFTGMIAYIKSILRSYDSTLEEKIMREREREVEQKLSVRDLDKKRQELESKKSEIQGTIDEAKAEAHDAIDFTHHKFREDLINIQERHIQKLSNSRDHDNSTDLGNGNFTKEINDATTRYIDKIKDVPKSLKNKLIHFIRTNETVPNSIRTAVITSLNINDNLASLTDVTEHLSATNFDNRALKNRTNWRKWTFRKADNEAKKKALKELGDEIRTKINEWANRLVDQVGTLAQKTWCHNIAENTREDLNKLIEQRSEDLRALKERRDEVIVKDSEIKAKIQDLNKQRAEIDQLKGKVEDQLSEVSKNEK